MQRVSIGRHLLVNGGLRTAGGLDVGSPKQQVHRIGSIWQKALAEGAVHNLEDLVIG